MHDYSSRAQLVDPGQVAVHAQERAQLVGIREDRDEHRPRLVPVEMLVPRLPDRVDEPDTVDLRVDLRRRLEQFGPVGREIDPRNDIAPRS